MSATHTEGPWRWEFNREHRSLHLVGGKKLFDLTILEPTRWGMSGAGLMLRDTAHDGMNIMHKVHERADWVAPFWGRSHHASWCASIIHPDMRLMESAPVLLEDLVVAAAQLRKYEALHRAKGTPESTEKAEVNAGLAARFETTVAKATGVLS